MSQILLTGASGRLGTHLRNWFTAKGRAFLATDMAPSSDGAAIAIADLADRAAVDNLMAHDISAVVHFGGMAKEAGWQTVLEANIMGAYNVFEAARNAGVGRIIFASSYHVQGMYPTGDTPITLDQPYRPDSLYGVSKVFGETLSRLYFDKFGIECLAIRICTAGNPGTPREARLWFNRDDLASLVDHALDMPALGHRTIFGISNNPNAFYINSPDPDFGWSPRHGSLELGTPDPHEPLDPTDARNRLTGGIFAEWGHFDDEPAP
ncbi:NAD-dependent epimerase/dehydratase family protein [Devosia lacusdianchii]|uniref:NAD-dependent epimerase/dehydratase family protein n=1 Tax=Devosia lacusdianchii TaxID=2917991 RepID=UPI001F06BECC|nr:NAD(P)-dependent oxidoreductase [Devosia sp. JXJ CY 41]